MIFIDFLVHLPHAMGDDITKSAKNFFKFMRGKYSLNIFE